MLSSKWYLANLCLSFVIVLSKSHHLHKNKHKEKKNHHKHAHDKLPLETKRNNIHEAEIEDTLNLDNVIFTDDKHVIQDSFIYAGNEKPKNKISLVKNRPSRKHKDNSIAKPTFKYVDWPNWLPKDYHKIRTLDPEWNKTGDCLFKIRNNPRPYPNDCYPRNKYSTDGFNTFWKNIRGQLSYTFDTVLWDDDAKHKITNQFWYLISYLKQMAIIFQSPDQVGAKDNNELNTQIDSLISDSQESIYNYTLSLNYQSSYIIEMNRRNNKDSAEQNAKFRGEDSNLLLESNEKPSITKNNNSESSFLWTKTSLIKAHLLGNKALVGGEDVNGNPLWVIRVQSEDSDVNIGQFNPNTGIASVLTDDKEVLIHNYFDVLCNKNTTSLKWVKYKTSDPFPKNAVHGGEFGISTKLSIGRIKQDGHYIPGKIVDNMLYIPHKGQVYEYNDDFEVLIETNETSRKFHSYEDSIFTWEETNFKKAHLLSDRAVVGGEEHGDMPLWIIRAELDDNHTIVGKFSPERNFASVSKDGHEVVVDGNFYVLCEKNKDAHKWVKYKKSQSMPKGAVVGADMKNSTKMLVGKIKLDGHYVPGKIIGRVLHIPYQGKEYQFDDSFEVLVESKKPNILRSKPKCSSKESTASVVIWEKTNLKDAPSLSSKAVVGGWNEQGLPLWVMRAKLEDNKLDLGKYDPNRTIAKVLKGNQEVSFNDDIEVLCMENLGDLYWVQYVEPEPWPENAVVAIEMENSTKVNVGRVKIRDENIPGKIINKVLYVGFKGRVYPIEDDFEVLVQLPSAPAKTAMPTELVYTTEIVNSAETSVTIDPPPEDDKQEISITPVLSWIQTTPDKAQSLSNTALVGGANFLGYAVWVVRAKLEGGYQTVGKFNPGLRYASVPKDGNEVLVHGTFDVLCENIKNVVEWLQFNKTDPWPEDAVVAGNNDSEPIFVGRAMRDEYYTPGKIINKVLYVPNQGQEFNYSDNYEILVKRRMPKMVVNEKFLLGLKATETTTEKPTKLKGKEMTNEDMSIDTDASQDSGVLDDDA